MNLRQTLIRISTAASVGAMIGGWVLVARISSAPTSPNAGTGHVVPFSIHGTYVYLTHGDDSLLSIASVTGVVGVLLTASLLLFGKGRK